MNDEELINSIVAQNDLGEQNEIKILFKMANNKGKNVIISCHHSTFNKILRKGKVCLNWERYNVRKFLRPLQCFKCYKYGHLAKYCRGIDICSNCRSTEHKHDTCESITKCINCDYSNTKYGTKYNIDHNVRDKNCNICINEINQNRTDYGPE